MSDIQAWAFFGGETILLAMMLVALKRYWGKIAVGWWLATALCLAACFFDLPTEVWPWMIGATVLGTIGLGLMCMDRAGYWKSGDGPL